MKKGFWGKPRKQTVCLSRQVVLSGKRKEDKEAMKGKFTGVGVGPGDPQLLTLKALHAIQESDVVAIPVSDSGLKKPGENADPKYMQQCTDDPSSLFDKTSFGLSSCSSNRLFDLNVSTKSFVPSE